MHDTTTALSQVNRMTKLGNYLALMRISQWSKAIFVMLGVFYSVSSGYFFPAVLASIAFCLISSAVYIYNDIQDRSADNLHPIKRVRPLASGRVTLTEAVILLFILLLTGLLLGALISKKLAVILMIYLVINIAYNHLLKLIPVVDVTCIAFGFMLRVLAGTIGIGLPISIWLTITATILSFFIALNKRQLEIHLGSKVPTRFVLKKYHPLMLQRLIQVAGFLNFIVYLFYVIFARQQSFYFLLTVPFVAIALWRFAWLCYQPVKNDDPVNVFLGDRLSRVNLWCFVVLTSMALTHQ